MDFFLRLLWYTMLLLLVLQLLCLCLPSLRSPAPILSLRKNTIVCLPSLLWNCRQGQGRPLTYHLSSSGLPIVTVLLLLVYPSLSGTFM